MTELELAQKIFDGGATDAREACRRGTWAEHVRATAPKRPWLFAGRGDYDRCVEQAARSLAGPTTSKLVLVPLWACSSDEDESNDWVAVHGVAVAGNEPISVREIGPYFEDPTIRSDDLLFCTVRRWTAAVVVESKTFAPGIQLALRAGAFGVLAMDVHEVVDVEATKSEPVPRPSREVPAFSSSFEPRVQVEPALAKAIRAMSFTASDED